MRLVDSNILIFAAKPEYPQLKELLEQDDIAVSELSRLEVMGFPGLTDEAEDFFNAVLSVVTILPISQDVIDRAIEIRQLYNIKPADSIIAATALLHCSELITRDNGFNRIPEITLNNPIDN
jgi:predicted nucleic acid-binding protein